MCAQLLQSCPDSLAPSGLWPARLLCPWDSPGKDTGVGCHALLKKYIHSKHLINAHKLEAAKQYVALLVKNLPAMQETQSQFLGLEDPLEKGQATHASILAHHCGSAGKEYACKKKKKRIRLQYRRPGFNS